MGKRREQDIKSAVDVEVKKRSYNLNRALFKDDDIACFVERYKEDVLTNPIHRAVQSLSSETNELINNPSYRSITVQTLCKVAALFVKESVRSGEMPPSEPVTSNEDVLVLDGKQKEEIKKENEVKKDKQNRGGKKKKKKKKKK